MPRVFLYIFLCTKWLDKNEKLSVEQTRVLTVVHYPQFLLCLFWLWTLLWLESPFLAGNVFSQVGQQCQTDLKEVILSHFLWGFFSLNVTCFKWSEAVRDDLLSLSSDNYHIIVLADILILFKFSFKQSFYCIYWPSGKCLLSLFAAWIVSWSTLISQVFE